MAGLTKRIAPDRSKIAATDGREIRNWARKFQVSEDDLQKAIDKVGNSIAAVRKELQTEAALKASASAKEPNQP